MTRRALFLDEAPGEVRGVVTLDNEPERLILRRDDDDPGLRQGARLAARVMQLEPALGSAFLDLGEHREALLSFRPEARPARGGVLEVEIRSEPRRGKLATVRVIGPAEGPPRLLAECPSLEDELRHFAREMEIVRGRAARQLADEAEALETVHPLPGGGNISIEVTRALVAIDVDLGERKGGDAKRVTRQANLAALGVAARLLRLKGLGGLVVLDLVGRGHDGLALLSQARAAFGPDNPGVAIGPVSRFGTMELSIPRRTRPVEELLRRDDGRLSDRSLAQRLVRRLQDEAECARGARILARAPPPVVQLAWPLVQRLAQVLGDRFAVSPDPGMAAEECQVAAQ